MMQSLARFAKDSYYLSRTPHSAASKAALWWHLIYPSRRMLGFEISAFDRPTLAYLYREIFARQNYYFRSAGESPLVYDCGANLGMATLFFKWLYPKARIEAFEPDPATFQLLEKNISQNQMTNVVAHNCALWDENGKVEFFIDPNTSGSLLMSTDAQRLGGRRIEVPSRKLSEFISEPIDFLKLDVEGAEHRVIQDLVASGKAKLINQMVIEYHHHVGNQSSCLAEFLRMLESAGFEYQVQATVYPVTMQGVFQDMLIGAYRRQGT